jgi:hypothetical protein
MTMAIPRSSGRFFNSLVYASRPPADPPTQTIGKSLAAWLIVISTPSYTHGTRMVDGSAAERSMSIISSV